jgi:hypothetical protein
MNTNDLCESILDALIHSWADDPTHTVAESREQSLAVIKHVVDPVIAEHERDYALIRENWNDAETRIADLERAITLLGAPLAPVEGTWEWASAQLKAGKAVVRASTGQRMLFSVHTNYLYNSGCLNREAFEATDWRIADEPAPDEGKES